MNNKTTITWAWTTLLGHKYSDTRTTSETHKRLERLNKLEADCQRCAPTHSGSGRINDKREQRAITAALKAAEQEGAPC